MKKSKKILSVLLACLMVLSCLSATAFAADGLVGVKLRVEGITSNLFNSTVFVKDGSTVLDALKAADKLSVVTVDSYYGPYVSEINGEKEKTFGGFDGWNFLLNDASPEVGVSACTVTKGDSVVFYYGDTYLLGMQYPKADTSKISEGIITFTSEDTTYDPITWEPVVSVNPVKNMTVTWNYGSGKNATYTTDDNGQIKIDKDCLTNGYHALSVSRNAVNGCPTVLRLAPDYKVETGNHFFNLIASFFQRIIDTVKTLFETITSAIGGKNDKKAAA